MIISLIVWLVVGFIAGYLAKLIMPGPDGGGVIATILLGIVGAIVGGWIGRAVFDNAGANDGFSIMGLVFAVIGALVVLAIYRLATGRSLRA
jgi:uncharacterized membrane protein YeaQ/YmgE (transglycosylase-associated protein family)